MFNCYDDNIIPTILNVFKVKNIVICGISDRIPLNMILGYCKDNGASYTAIDSKDSLEKNFIKGDILKELSKLNNYDAIFIDSNPNWYHVYNELKLVKQNNKEFPLVFIYNNIFPHKRRDSYINPDIIPDKFRNEYSRELVFKGISIRDSFYHAIEENTPKNGVQTAIEDFLSVNNSIGLMDINFVNGLDILYPLNSISHLRMGKLNEEIGDEAIEFDNMSDSIIENELLINYFSRIPLSNDDFDIIENYKNEVNEKEQLLNEFKNELDLNNTELSYKNSKIDGFNSKLSLKDSQIKNIESKLVNREIKINTLNNELKSANSQINSLKIELNEKENKFNSKISDANSQIDSLKNDASKKRKLEAELNDLIKENNEKLNEQNRVISLKDNQLRLKQDELNENMDKLNSLKNINTRHLAKLDDTEYCISCYKEEIMNNHLEIQYLKKETLLRKLSSPFAYVYLILKSNPNELSLNFKLYRALKNSKCFDIGYYLNNNEDLRESKWCNYFSPELHYV